MDRRLQMTRVCLLGSEGVDLRDDLLAYETARDALSTYSIDEPYENAIALDTISIGAAVSLLNDLNWYLVRLVDDAFVLEPSVSESEWLSRGLATAIRNDEIEPSETGTLLKIYGVVDPDDDGQPRLTEPMFTQRVTDETPEYDLHDVDRTLVVRVTREEFSA